MRSCKTELLKIEQKRLLEKKIKVLLKINTKEKEGK